MSRLTTLRRFLDQNHELAVFMVLMVVMLLVGTIGFHLLEGWTYFQSAYATVITLTSVGYGDFAPETNGGRLFAIILVSFGLGTVAYVFSNLANLLLSAESRRRSRMRRMQRMVDHIHNHVILCGYGEMGQGAAKLLRDQGVPIVVVELSPKAGKIAEADRFPVLVGSASDDHILIQAGLERARALIATTKSDAENVFITLTARECGRQMKEGGQPLRIIARANESTSRAKLERAGADRIISPYSLGAESMANLVRRPNVADFIDGVMHTKDVDLALEEVEVSDDSGFGGTTLMELETRRKFGVTVLAVLQPNGDTTPAPDPAEKIDSGAVLVCFGTREGLEAFSAFLQRKR